MYKFIYLLALFCSISTTSMAQNDPTSVNLHIRLAQLYLQNDNLFGALKEYRVALECAPPDSVDLHLKVAGLYYRLGFIDRSIKSIKQAIQLKPNIDFFHHRLGLLYFSLRNYSKARIEFIRALELNPGAANSCYYLALTLKEQGYQNVAQLFSQAAQNLGHPAETLYPELKPSNINVWLEDTKKVCLRQLLVSDQKAANILLSRINNGTTLFEEIASQEFGSTTGGYIGCLPPEDLQAQVILSINKDGNIPGKLMVMGSDDGYNLFQRLAPINWDMINSLLNQNISLLSAPPIEEIQTVQIKEIHEPAVPDKVYVVQAGAYRKKHYATEKIAQIKSLGFDSYLTVKELKGAPWFEVFSGGQFNSLKQAQKYKKQLNISGIEAFVHRTVGLVEKSVLRVRDDLKVVRPFRP